MDNSNTNIFLFGSCRVYKPLRHIEYLKDINPLTLSFRAHYLSEIIQMINYCKDEIHIPSELKTYVFRNQEGMGLASNIKSNNTIMKADRYVVEISSIKNIEYKGLYFHLLSDLDDFQELKNISIYRDKEEDILNKMKKICELLDNKPILFVPHCNVNTRSGEKIPQRDLIDKAIIKGCKILNKEFLNIRSIINRIGYKKSFDVVDGYYDINHYTPLLLNEIRNEMQIFLNRNT